jgi:hypothetical protein
MEKFDFLESVRWHEHFGTHDGQEAGFECSLCYDAVMGGHPKHPRPPAEFPPEAFCSASLDADGTRFLTSRW